MCMGGNHNISATCCTVLLPRQRSSLLDVDSKGRLFPVHHRFSIVFPERWGNLNTYVSPALISGLLAYCHAQVNIPINGRGKVEIGFIFAFFAFLSSPHSLRSLATHRLVACRKRTEGHSSEVSPVYNFDSINARADLAKKI